MPLRSLPYATPIRMSTTDVSDDNPSNSSAAAAARAASSSCACGDSVQVRALVAERQVQQIAAVSGDDSLDVTDERVELRDRVAVFVVIDAAEVDEQWIRRSQLREKVSATVPKPLVHGRQHPRADDVGRKRRYRQKRGRGFEHCRKAVDHAARAATTRVHVALENLHTLA
jgi:hypothetical protein